MDPRRDPRDLLGGGGGSRPILGGVRDCRSEGLEEGGIGGGGVGGGRDWRRGGGIGTTRDYQGLPGNYQGTTREQNYQRTNRELPLRGLAAAQSRSILGGRGEVGGGGTR